MDYSIAEEEPASHQQIPNHQPEAFLNSIEVESIIDNNINNTQYEEIDERDENIDDVFNQAFEYFKNTEPIDRPFIPKQKCSKRLSIIVAYINNKILPQKLNTESDFITLQNLIYCSAWTAAKLNGSKLNIPTPNPVTTVNHTDRPQRHKPFWQKRLEKKILDLRSKISKLEHYMRGVRSEHLNQQVDSILRQYTTHSVHENPNTQHSHFLDTLKQKLTIVSSRLRRYNKCTHRKTQNNIFTNNERKFYRNLNATTNSNQTNDTTNETPDPDRLQEYWSRIWSDSAQYNADASWISTERDKNINTPDMDFEHISIEIFHEVIKKTHNWKAPGSDRIHNFWYKKLTTTHPYIYNFINKFIKHPEEMPEYITLGTTFMLPKDSEDPTNPSKYRPITCLQTFYKILTGCIANIIYSHLNTHKILTEQQKGCKKFSQGCKEQITIDTIILKQVQKHKTDLFSTYIDYKKAFDSVPHCWLIEVLHIYKINPQLINFLQISISKWSTRLQLNSTNSIITTDPIKIRRGIFQGDALSPLWFCLALNPLSNLLNSLNIGFKLKYDDNDIQTDIKLNHLLYMDDIKLYTETQTDMDTLIKTTEQFSTDINMEFGIDKCRTNSTLAGQNHEHSYELQSGNVIKSLNEFETYKYLGFHQMKQIQQKETKLQLTRIFKHRLNSILKSELNARNTVKAINTFAIPILTYSFGIINWSKTDLKNLQRTINVLMTKHRKHHPRACVQRQTLPRKEGGRGLIDIINLHNKQITTLRQYFFSKATESDLHKASIYNDIKYTPLNLHDKNSQPNEQQIKNESKIIQWTQKSLHGRHRLDLSHPNVDKDASNEWLNRGVLFPETEGFMVAIQDQIIETRNYQKFIIKNRHLPTDLCRRCNSSSETIQHITGACKSIVQTDYKHRHDQVANIIHQKLALKYKLISTYTPYYKYIPDTVLENSTHKLYFDRAILTDRTTHFNRPDITLLDKSNKSALIIDIAIPNTHNLQHTIAEKLSKYQDLKDEITRMWRLDKVTIVPIVLSTTGVIPIQLRQSLRTLQLPEYTYASLQKAAILNTCRIVRKFLQVDSSNSIPDVPILNSNDVHLT